LADGKNGRYLKVSEWLFAVVGATLTLMGVLALAGFVGPGTPSFEWILQSGAIRQEIAEQIVGALTPPLLVVFRTMFASLYMGIGLLFLGLDLTGLRRGERWAWYVLFFTGLVTLTPALYLQALVFVFPPIALVYAIFLTAVLLSGKEIFRKGPTPSSGHRQG